MEQLLKLQEIIDNSERLVFFTGAGISTESNIPDFRSTDGLYNQAYQFPPEIILSATFFKNNPEEFYRFYRDKMLYPDALPNRAHQFISEIEKSGREVTVITQNIDDLHQKAGSSHVITLHGSVYKNHCIRCKKSFEINAILSSRSIPRCSCGGIIKPDVVLYEENLNDQDIRDAINAISNADTMIICGTSLTVYPAAGMIQYFKGKNLIIINKTVTQFDQKADLCIKGSIGETLSSIQINSLKK